MVENREQRRRAELMSDAFVMFTDAAKGGVVSSFYYIGEMLEFGDGVEKVDLRAASEFFTISASFEYPRAYFKLAKL